MKDCEEQGGQRAEERRRASPRDGRLKLSDLLRARSVGACVLGARQVQVSKSPLAMEGSSLGLPPLSSLASLSMALS